VADKTSGELIRANLDLLVLSALAEEPKYGYRIQQSLAASTGGLVEVQAGPFDRPEAEVVRADPGRAETLAAPGPPVAGVRPVRLADARTGAE
jgi:hypothetical protein